MVVYAALDMVTTAKSNGLTEFVNLLDMAGLTSRLQSEDNITVFAPTNEAIKVEVVPVRVAWVRELEYINYVS